MLNYILRRLIIAFFMLIGIAFVSFIVIQLPPGDVATNYKAFLLQQPGVSEEDAERQADQRCNECRPARATGRLEHRDDRREEGQRDQDR